MSTTNNPFIACCGLDCEACEARLATISNDNALRAKVAEEWSRMNQMEILPEWINCEGCRLDGCKTYYCSHQCLIRQCALGKGYETCAECSELSSCRTVGELLDNAADAKQRLQGMAVRY